MAMELEKGNVYFFCDYNRKDSGRNLVMPLAGVTWLEYIVDSIKRTGRKVTIVSTSCGVGRSYLKRKRHQVDELEEVIYLPSLNKEGGSLKLRVSQLFSMIEMALFVVFNTNKADKLLIFHNYGLSVIMSKVRRMLKRHYIYVVGEVFSAVYDRGDDAIMREIQTIKGADGYIVANTLLPEYIDDDAKYCVCHGSYVATEMSSKAIADGIKRAVYAGKIAQKDVNDAFVAAESARWLDENFHIHILGYGTDEDIEALRKTIDKTNEDKGYSVVSYDGCLSGAEYDAFLSRCDIGLCTRAMKEPNCNMCFPSKTLVYLTHGLTVICPDIKVLRESKVAPMLRFMEHEISPEEVAKAIKSCGSIDNSDIAIELRRIDEEFVKEVDNILS